MQVKSNEFPLRQRAKKLRKLTYGKEGWIAAVLEERQGELYGTVY